MSFVIWLWNKFAGEGLDWIGKLVKALVAAFWDLLTDLVCWVVEKMLDIAVAAASTFDTAPFTAAAAVFGEIPPELLNVLALLGVGTAISIITAAITIRLVLQLIPFVRLGS